VAKAADVDLGHFDSPEWHDRMACAVREVIWRSSELAYSGVGLLASLPIVIWRMNFHPESKAYWLRRELKERVTGRSALPEASPCATALPPA
jgi:hypothetical protein